jgi:sugar phosphate isomerase/epimerase
MAVSDPTLPDAVVETGKHVGTGGIGAAFVLLMSRFFGGQDRVIARLDIIQSSLNMLTQQHAVTQSDNERNKADIQRAMDAIEKLNAKVATMEGTLAQLREGLHG